MVVWILAGLGVYLASVFLAGMMLFSRIGPAAYMGPRDNLPEQGLYYERARKAAANFAETLPIFLALAVLSLVLEGVDIISAQLGAMLYVGSRVIYIPVYLSGVPFIRSAVFMVGFLGLGLMAYALI